MISGAILNVAIISVGIVMMVAGVGVWGKSHQASVYLLLVGCIIAAVGAIRVAHRLPSDSSPW